jgi:hypothetical protein
MAVKGQKVELNASLRFSCQSRYKGQVLIQTVKTNTTYLDHEHICFVTSYNFFGLFFFSSCFPSPTVTGSALS